jgi:hypothetical protein
MQLENAMRTLTTNPGRFDSLVAQLVDTISPYLDQPKHCEEIFNMIIQQVYNFFIIFFIMTSFSVPFHNYACTTYFINNNY